MLDTPHVTDLTLMLRVSELELHIRELQHILGQFHFDASLGLLPIEERLLALIMGTECLTRKAAQVALYGDRSVERQPHTDGLDVHISKIRKKVAPIGVKIDTLWGVGWTTSQADRDRLKTFARHYD